VAALLGLIGALAAHAGDPAGLAAFAPRPLWQAGDTPRARNHHRIVEWDGRVYGRSRTRRRARYTLWSLDDGTVVRLEERERGQVVLRRRFDPLGMPLTTVKTPRDGWPSVVVHGVPDREIGLSGWDDHALVGATVPLPTPPLADDSGAWVLGGEVAFWHDPASADVTSDGYWEGLVAGCGCDLIDRTAAWVDGHPAVRFRLARGDDLEELWAVPLSEREGGGTWYAAFRAPDVDPDPARSAASIRLAPGRALVALVRLDRLPIEEESVGDP